MTRSRASCSLSSSRVVCSASPHNPRACTRARNSTPLSSACSQKVQQAARSVVAEAADAAETAGKEVAVLKERLTAMTNRMGQVEQRSYLLEQENKKALRALVREVGWGGGAGQGGAQPAHMQRNTAGPLGVHVGGPAALLMKQPWSSSVYAGGRGGAAVQGFGGGHGLEGPARAADCSEGPGPAPQGGAGGRPLPGSCTAAAWPAAAASLARGSGCWGHPQHVAAVGPCAVGCPGPCPAGACQGRRPWQGHWRGPNGGAC